MLFSTYEFIFCFLPFTLIVYFLLGHISSRREQHMFLIAMSLVFYGYFKASYLYVITLSVGVNYIVVLVMQKYARKKLMLAAGIIFNLCLFGYFKYTDFFIENFNMMTGSAVPLEHILLPLGISFFTFQQFSFLLGVYRGHEKAGNFVDYCLFVTFFPQLIAGPIVLYGEMMPQFEDAPNTRANYANIACGLYIFTLGLFKKLVIADSAALFADNGFAMDSPGMAAAWAASLSYTFQIYFDFSGYCDMATGLASMFNIRLPINFNSPYKSQSITEFWRRWHMTLGRALAYYVYIPLGGNRNGKLRTYVNLMAAFLASGLWHGAAWSFVLWGVLHGAFSVCDRIFEEHLKKLPAKLRIACTFLIVNFLWVLFRAKDTGEAMKIYRGMLDLRNVNFAQLRDIGFDRLINFPSALFIANVTAFLSFCFIIVFCCDNSVENKNRFTMSYRGAIWAALLFFFALLHMSKPSPFIYYNF